ncbi:ferredoxin--NADP(+) reductase [Enterobacteriaceae endosymbiont of Plateumaris consimilis]|uniref:FAD-binding oxidoreductase n=1 Tax=Enterobacteriaceae endosymbiont of Plateumaris consimilis TaxID=2675794 RepID=UPI0014492CD3|nr:FAD-binding oxidoreductase [Enterobacteriaceae endosymbiont of Plateumaris consimilis]QJC28607.1 ferredoxin--NADP(+) reductase [Enterobacteriaceae endosymbiont of Plateumaris consimilis]
MTEWVIGKVKKINYWENNLFTIILNAKVNPFVPGQFTKLSLIINGKRIHRAYSYINCPKNINHEFYIKNVDNKGHLTPYLYKLNYNDKIMISKHALGTFTINNIQNCENLWMISTGTGIGPYLSILQNGNYLENFKKIILIYAVRYISDFSYIYLINNLKNKFKNKLIIQIITSREKQKNNLLKGHIPELIQNGILEKKIGILIDKNNTHIMLCGNPKMVYDTQNLLQKNYGLSKNLKNKIGNITTEKYW